MAFWNPHHPFPKHIFSRIVLVQIGLILLAAGTAIFFPKFLIPVLVGLVLIILWSSKEWVFPLGRLLLKAQNIAGKRDVFTSSDELGREPFGEWSDLESTLEDLGRSLERTNQTLSMEQVELETVMSAISDGIVAIDTEGVPVFFNSKFERTFCQGPLRRSTRLWEIFRDPEILAAFKTALKDGKSALTRVFAFESPGQPKRYFALSVAPLRKQAGAVYAALGTFHDVTDLKVAEQMRIDFVANVSHELRTPLTSIKGYAETLLQDCPKNQKETQEHLQVVMRNANRLMNLMDDLLDLSSIESTHVLQRENILVKEVTDKVVKQLAVRFEMKKQTAERRFETETVVADAVRLEQVLINLLDNACKYTPEGGKISIYWNREPQEVVLRIKDTGPGISVEHQARLFERFYRVDKARSREQGGTGLGLSIVKHIMQRHGGTVSVESIPGHGAEFICRFPAMIY